MSTVAIVPARKGSKGVPRKNVRLLAGRPLIEYSIRAGLSATFVDRTVVTTDDPDAAEIARELGVQVIERPPHLAVDEAPMMPVVLHVLDTLAATGFDCDNLTLLQPTCPFRRPTDIDQSIASLDSSGADAVIGVCALTHDHPAWMYRVENERLVPLDFDGAGRNRQDLPPLYRRNGAIYTVRCAAARSQGKLLVEHAVPYYLDAVRSINIDDPYDWAVAQALAPEYLQ